MKPTLAIKNKRQKMSPGGLITLPLSARKALGMVKGKGSNTAVKVDGGNIVISQAARNNDGIRISQRGLMMLPAEAKRILEAAAKRHYWFEVYDANHQVILYPFKA